MTYLLNTGTTPEPLKDWWAHGATAFALFALIFCLWATIPEYRKLVKYKKTTGINKKFYILQLITSILYFYGSSFLFAKSIIDKEWSSLPTGILFAVLNWIGSMGNLYIVLLKSKNVKESRDMGITEKEHFEKVYLPALEIDEEEA